MKVKFLLICLIFLFPWETEGATYYVATNGNDSYSKSQAQNVNTPWKTLNHAESQLVSGDTVFVRGGTYREQLYIEVGGVTFQNYSGETPIIDGDDGDGWPFERPDYNGLITIRYAANNVTVDGFRVINSNKVGIHIWNDSSSSTIKNCTTYYTGGNGITAGGSYGLIENNNVSYHNLNINPSICAGGLGTSSTWGAGLTTGTSANTGIIIRGNTVHDGCGEGISVSWESANVVVEDNIVYDNRAIGIYVDTANNVTVRNNIIYCTRNSDWYRFSGVAGIAIAITNEHTEIGYNGGHKIYNNLVADCYNGMGVYYWGTSPSPVDDVQMYHNTIVESYNSDNNDTAFQISSPTGIAHTNIKVRNNIIVNTVGTLAYASGDTVPVCSNNLWWDGAGGMPTIMARGSGDVYENPNLWRSSGWNSLTAGGHDANDWKIRSSSPAKDAGLTLGSTYSIDFADVSRPQGDGWDIGAYEFLGRKTTIIISEAKDEEIYPLIFPVYISCF